MNTNHGPECGEGPECHCVLCHCAELHEPGGFLGTCQRCGRPQRRTEQAA